MRERSFVVLCAALLAVMPATGSAAWRQQIAGSQPLAVAVDAAGDVVAAGDGTLADVFKFDGVTGALLWSRDIDGTAAAVTTDAAGDVMVVGQANGPGTILKDLLVVKLSGATGAIVWRTTIDGDAMPSSDDVDRGLAVAVDASGDVFAAGTLVLGGGDKDFAVLKLAAATGAEVWRHTIGGTDASGIEAARAVRIDGAGAVVAAGAITNAATGPDFLVVKLSAASGAEAWRTVVDGTATTDFDDAMAIAVYPSGDVVASGRLSVGGGLVRLAGGTGAEVWRREIADLTGVTSVALDGAGDVVAAGTDQSSLFVFPTFVVLKVAGTTGADVWRQALTGTGGQSNRADVVAVDGNDDVLAAGFLDNRRTNVDLAVVKLDGSSGDEIWRQSVDGSGGATALALRAGDAVVSGSPGNAGGTVLELSGADGAVGFVSGKRLSVRDRAGDPAGRRIQFVLTDQSIVTPAPGSAGDPTVAGGTLRLVNPTTSETATFPLNGSWKGLGSPPGSRGYRWSGVGGPCSTVIVRAHRGARAVCSGSLVPFTLDEPTQGSLAVSIQLGSAATQCALFGGTVTADEGTANPGPTGLFKARNAPPASGSCP